MTYNDFVTNILNADRDAIDLGRILNDEPNKQIPTRLGRLVWTLATLNNRLDNFVTASNQQLANNQSAHDAQMTAHESEHDAQMADFDNAIQTAKAAGAGANGWTTDLVAEGNKTQKQINADVAVKILRAADIGLTKWSDFKKPPYTTAEYNQAYNNGVNLAKAVKAANDAGYNKVVLERGNYPVCYSNNNDSQQYGSVKLDGTKYLDVDGNGSTLFVLFDSNNKSPYDKRTSQPAYNLGGNVFLLINNTNLNIYGFELRGDQYNRAWVTGEDKTENTCGIYMQTNNINTKINVVAHGFRADGVSGNTRAISIASLDNNWSAGGINTSTGAEITESGSYRSPRIDLSTATIYRNAVQIYTTGYLRAAEFRNDLLAVFFYDTNGAFISTENARQCDFIYLPKNCRYIQFVAYEDERTDPTVGYGTFLYLGTGASNFAQIKGEYFANMRGGISNLCNNTKVDAFIHDIGSLKYGFPHYGDPTRYAINFEDIYVSRLDVSGVIQNCAQAVLCNARELNMSASVKNTTFSGAAIYSTFIANITKCDFDNVGNLLDVQKAVARRKGRVVNFVNNIVKNSDFYFNISDNPDVFINCKTNIFNHCIISLVANNNLAFDNNNILSVKGRYADVCSIKNALSAKNNTFSRNMAVTINSQGWGGINVSAATANDNYFIVEQEDQKIATPTILNEIPIVIGTDFKISDNLVFTPIRKTDISASHIDNRIIKNCGFSGGSVYFGAMSTYADLTNFNYTVNNCKFDNGCYIYILRNDSGGSTGTIEISDTVFDLTSSTYLIRNAYTLVGAIDIKFINCTFKSSTAKSIAFVRGQTANLTAKLINCKLINVTNTDTITTIQGQAKVTYDPPSLATATQQSTTVTLTGAKLGDNLNVSFDKALSGTRIWAEVTADNTVTVYHRNDTGATVDLPSGALTVKIV